MKKVLAVLFATVLFVLPIFTVRTTVNVAATSDAPSFVVSTAHGNRGETVTVTVFAIDNPGIVSFRLKIGYDASALSLKSVQGGVFSNVSFGPLTGNPVIVGWVDAIHDDNRTNGVIATLTFTVKKNAPLGTSAITVTHEADDVYNFNFDNVTFRNVNGSVTVTDPAVQTGVNSSVYTVTDTTIGKITADTTVATLLSNLTGGETCTVLKGNTRVAKTERIGTGMTVQVTDGNTVKATYTTVVTGDLNGDGNVTVTDMLAVKSHVLKKSTLSGVYAVAGDVNADQNVSVTDFIQIKADILGKQTIIPW